MGENKKRIEKRDKIDVPSPHYSRHHRLSRVLRREIDFWRTREYARLDLGSILKTDVVDIGLGELQSVWFDEGGGRSARHSLSRVAHQVHAIFTDRSSHFTRLPLELVSLLLISAAGCSKRRHQANVSFR